MLYPIYGTCLSWDFVPGSGRSPPVASVVVVWGVEGALLLPPAALWGSWPCQVKAIFSDPFFQLSPTLARIFDASTLAQVSIIYTHWLAISLKHLIDTFRSPKAWWIWETRPQVTRWSVRSQCNSTLFQSLRRGAFFMCVCDMLNGVDLQVQWLIFTPGTPINPSQSAYTGE